MSYTPTNIKRIQRGDIAVNNSSSTGTSTLANAVDVTKTELRFLGVRSNSSTDLGNIRLTDSTTVMAERVGTTGNQNYTYEVTEYVTTVF